MKLIQWARPSGVALETNASDATIEYLESLGYKQIKGNTSEKDKLETYAKNKFGVDLDKRKNLNSLKAQVQELEDVNRD